MDTPNPLLVRSTAEANNIAKFYLTSTRVGSTKHYLLMDIQRMIYIFTIIYARVKNSIMPSIDAALADLRSRI